MSQQVPPWASASALSQLSREPFGLELSERFVEALQHKSAFSRTHQGYCGWIAGYSPKREQFIFTRSYEGYIGANAENKPDLVWSLKQKLELIDWLAHQSDYSMSGAEPDSKVVENDPSYRNNQTFTEQYIRDFLLDVDKGAVYYDPFKDY